MSFRNALQPYIDNPDGHAESVLFSDENVVIIKDAFPKSIGHLLILPRKHSLEHPMEIFTKDVAFYKLIATYVPMAKKLLAELLRAENWAIPDEQKLFLFINVGVHAIPSLRNLHVHVISRDFHSGRLKNRKHYNSFNTDFFVAFDQLGPSQSDRQLAVDAAESDTDIESGTESAIEHPTTQVVRRITTEEEKKLMSLPLKCVYCGRNFDNKFSQLKVHLAQEFKHKFPDYATRMN